MKYDFSDQVVVITGATGNVGVSVAHAFQRESAKLALIDHSADCLPKRFPEWPQSNDYLFIPSTDVTDLDTMKQKAEEIHRHFGRIDVLVNTVGGYRAGQPLHETPLGEWDLMLNLNARSVLVTCQAI